MDSNFQIQKYRNLFCIAILAVLSIYFYQPLMEMGAGALFRWALRLKGDCHLAYRNLEWKEGRFLLSDAALFDARGPKSSFHIHAEEMGISFDWSSFPRKLKGHLTVEKPHLSFLDWKGWKKSGGWLDFTVSVREGLVEWPDIERAQFSYERATPDQMGRLFLSWGESSLSLEAVQENKEWRIDGDLKQLNGSLLKKLISFYTPEYTSEWKIEKGILNGWIHLLAGERGIESGSAHLGLQNGTILFSDCDCRELNGYLDWEGKFQTDESIGILRDLGTLSCSGRIRAIFDHLNLYFPEGSIEDFAGNFTFNPGMGAKWEFSGKGRNQKSVFPFSGHGRGYFHSQIENWLEGEFRMGESAFFLQAREKEQSRIWAGKIELSAPSFCFLQTIASSWFPEVLDWSWTQGHFSGEGTATFSKGGINSWTLSRFKIEDFFASKEDLHFSCGLLNGVISNLGGEVVFTNGEIQMPLGQNSFEGKGWSGQALWAEERLMPSHFSGWIEQVQTGLEISGTWKHWKAKGELAGFIAGTFSVLGGNEKNQLEIEGEVEGIQFSGQSKFQGKEDFSFQINRFEGQAESLSKFWEGSSLGGRLVSIGEGFSLSRSPEGIDWSLQGAFLEGTIVSHPFIRLENVDLEFYASPEGISCYALEGNWVTPQGKIALESPRISKIKGNWDFDVRVKGKVWDHLRLAGFSSGKEIFFDEKKSHFFGSPLYFTHCTLIPEGVIDGLDVQFSLKWDSLLAALPFFENLGWNSLLRKPLSGGSHFHISYQKEGGSQIEVQGEGLHWEKEPITLQLKAYEQEGEWKVDQLQVGDLSFSCFVKKEGNIFQILQGEGKWKESIQACFEGKASNVRSEFALSKVGINLEKAAAKWNFPTELKGMLEGSGHLIYDRGIEWDFDFKASQLQAGPLALENKGEIHLNFSSDKGFLLRGVDLQGFKEGVSWIGCKVDLMQFDAVRSHWIFCRSHLHLPADLFSLWPSHPPFLPSRFEHDLDFTGDLECASNFSSFICNIKEGFIPFNGAVRHIQDLYLSWKETQCQTAFHYLHQGHLIKLGLNIDFDPILQGTLVLEDEEYSLREGESPLSIAWEYENELSIQSIVGNFGGIDASFYAEEMPHSLIGNAKLNFSYLSEILPPSAAEVFKELEMGRGYELKGRLSLPASGPHFSGLLSGKQLELFGYQFKTLLAHVDLGSEQMRISNVKISDTAGIAKVDEIFLETKNKEPWTLSIPHIQILELRPSLLQKPGEQMGTISPLVVREFNLNGLKGLLDEGKTWTAKGELHFINSYKREHTVLDLPADVLGRIVGLDLELLVPVCGTLSYELKEGYFYLQELKDSFSEGGRSEFFLEKETRLPTMDLDGNLQILVKMKQFVLFKLTEKFLISIEGKLNDPQFHLQKKKRFLGI